MYGFYSYNFGGAETKNNSSGSILAYILLVLSIILTIVAGVLAFMVNSKANEIIDGDKKK